MRFTRIILNAAYLMFNAPLGAPMSEMCHIWNPRLPRIEKSLSVNVELILRSPIPVSQRAFVTASVS